MSGIGVINHLLLTEPPSRTALAQPEHADAERFSRSIEQAVGNSESRSEDDIRAQVRDAAEKLVSSAFIIPVLQSLRENSQAASPFAPGAAERRFGPLLDERIADSIVQGGRFGLVDSMVERYTRIAATPPTSEMEVTA